MKSMIAYSIGIFIGTACFVIYSYYSRNHSNVISNSFETVQPLSETDNFNQITVPAIAVLTNSISPEILVKTKSIEELPGRHLRKDIDLEEFPNESNEILEENIEHFTPTTSDHGLRLGKDMNSKPIVERTKHGKVKHEAHARNPENSKTFNEEDCKAMQTTYDVVPGISWGSLPLEYQRKWGESQCDKYAKQSIVPVAPKPAPAVSTSVSEEEMPEDRGIKEDDVGAWCSRAKMMYNVIPLRSWGTLPQKKIVSWKKHRCDVVFTAGRINKKPISNCTANKNMNLKDKSLPLIAIMAGSSTRKTHGASTKNLALFNFLLPSLVRTLDCGFRYVFVIGYDVGDVFYDSDEGMSEVQNWFNKHVSELLATHGISMVLTTTKIDNTIKKPGPVFIAMARHVSTQFNPDYYYRVNDDTEMVSNWPQAFVSALRSLSPPYGVVGPNCEQGNTMILTHDFVHKTHLEIFEMNYYPVELVDWWMDDWISFIYGQDRSFKATSVSVIHHTGAHGQRYTVDETNHRHLQKLIVDARQKIRRWIMKHYTDNKEKESILKAFDQDTFDKFKHKNIPG